MALSTAMPDMGIKLILKPLKSEARWIGTRLQLEAEGFIPPTVQWLNGKSPERWDVGKDTIYFLQALGVTPGQQPTNDTLWVVRSLHHDGNWRKRMIEFKARELVLIANHGNKEWMANWKRHYEARRDVAFQEFKRKLTGEKRRGRRPYKHDARVQA